FATKERRDPHVVEQIRGVQADDNGNGHLIAGQILLIAACQEDIVEGRDIAQLFVTRSINGEKWSATAFLVVELDVDHAVVVSVRVGIEQYAIDNTEDSGGRADAEHQ